VKPVLWFRISAVLLVVFAVGHTFGFLTFHPHSEEGRAVWAAMNNVRFSEGSSTFSYGNFYLGFGLSISAFQLFEAWLVWMLASAARRGETVARTIVWGLFVLQIIGLGLSLRYFSVGPAALSGVAAFCLAMAGLAVRRPVSFTGGHSKHSTKSSFETA
jgi:hypothetical protein